MKYVGETIKKKTKNKNECKMCVTVLAPSMNILNSSLHSVYSVKIVSQEQIKKDDLRKTKTFSSYSFSYINNTYSFYANTETHI